MVLVDRLCRDFPHVSRTKGHSESTSLLGARPKSSAHCLVLAETARCCGTSAEFEYHDLREHRESDMESTTAGTKNSWRLLAMGKPTGSVLKETSAVSVTLSISVQKRHRRILLRALLRCRMREMHREPEVPVVECLDGLARITLKELAIIHFVKGGTLQNANLPQVLRDMGFAGGDSNQHGFSNT